MFRRKEVFRKEMEIETLVSSHLHLSLSANNNLNSNFQESLRSLLCAFLFSNLICLLSEQAYVLLQGKYILLLLKL